VSVSVIISNFNGARWLSRLLESLEAQQGVTLEVIVVDRHSSDESAEILARHSALKILHEAPQSGLVAGYHAGVVAAGYEHLFFCNEDMWFSADCLARLEREIDLERRIACADPWQWSYDGAKLIHAAPQIAQRWNRGAPHPWRPFEENHSLRCGQIVACACAGAVLIHRCAYEDVGGWDTSFFLDQEDTDLAIRLWQRDWLTVTVPEAKVFHAVGGSNPKRLPGRNRTVARRRYIYGLSNQFAVVWKLFSMRHCLLPLIPWSETLAKDLIRLRWRRAGWDIRALLVSLARLPQIFRFRRSNRVFNRERAGELFFYDSRFQLGSTMEPMKLSSEDAANSEAIDLSIALVTRNRPQWLAQCLASWRAQEVQPFEIVISDDSDESFRPEIRRIAARYDCRWIAGPRRGLYANRNNAFRAARGTHVMSADDDHTHPRDFVRSVVQTIAMHSATVWTFSERPADDSDRPLEVPGELRSNGTVGPAENPDRSAAVACGSTVYPKKVFDSGLCCDESYRFGALWYLWGHELRRAGFRIRHSAGTFVWHHAASSRERLGDFVWTAGQQECGVYVQATHALWISRRPIAILRVLCRALRLVAMGELSPGHDRKIRLSVHRTARAFKRAVFAGSFLHRSARAEPETGSRPGAPAEAYQRG
jgi:GT2 family glycosyltransferase